MNKTVLITGASSGFGRLTVKKFQQEGWNVIATMRISEKEMEFTELNNVLVTCLDVTVKDTITRAIAQGIERFGKIDVLVNNAGYALQGPMESTTDVQIERQFNVNVFGLINVTKAIIPHFRGNQNGIVINYSSIGGRVAFPYTSMYHATKFAVEGFTESLQYELNPLGIRLKLIEPGAYNTNINNAADWSFADGISDYKEGLDKAKLAMQAMGGASGQNPQDVADITYIAATDCTDILRYPVGGDAEQILGARSQMDDLQFKTMIRESLGL
ncbi:MAG: SDR family oxidoreductase [Bacteroidales bacterium]|jgi:NAD(P)-dependent dehydrogenase (short-subunit alcohol dehydrogenase family)|nr:SDR family oxidoreductase [Bacteroidales bacterium]